MSGILYIVGTPIGNLGDITLRALDTLKGCDLIACEDTRHSGVLLTKYEIKKPTMRCDAHKEAESAEKIISLLKEGKNIALITDAGMPCISDPGALLVNLVRESGVTITVVPGASAVISAMALSGITKRGFCFLGFLPEKKKDRDELLNPYLNIDIQLIFYVSPHDICTQLDYLYSVFGNRRIYLIKEITKLFENVQIGVLGEIKVDNPRGEFVLIIEGQTQTSKFLNLSVEEHCLALIESGLSKKDAIKQTARERGVSKDEVYKIAMNIEL